MTVRYCGAGGSDANSGLSWALRKLTLNGVEDTPVVAGDIVYVGPGVYRELLTVDVNGSAGNVIQYIGDYLGTNTDGVGGVVRITGSDNDQTVTRARCISATTKTFRSFTGFLLDLTSSELISLATNCQNITLDKILFGEVGAGTNGLLVNGLTQNAITVQNCYFHQARGAFGISFTHSATVSNAAHLVQNCIFRGAHASFGIHNDRVGGNTIKNSAFLQGGTAIDVLNALAAGQTVTVNNCIFAFNNIALLGTATSEIIENYNTLFGNNTARTNTNTGANSVTYPPLFDTRWFFQMVFAGAGPNNASQVIMPFDLSSYSALINLAGTGPTTTDIRGTAIQGAQREWGIAEYDVTLKKQGGGGAVAISPLRGNIG